MIIFKYTNFYKKFKSTSGERREGERQMHEREIVKV